MSEPTKKLLPDFAAFVAASIYVPRNVGVRVLTTGYETSDPDLHTAIVQILNYRVQKLEGLRAGLSVDDRTGVASNPSGPLDYVFSFQFEEQYGGAIEKLLSRLIRDNARIEVLYFEPDPTCTTIVRTWRGWIALRTSGNYPVKRDVEAVTGPVVFTSSFYFGGDPQDPSVPLRYDEAEDHAIAQELVDKINREAAAFDPVGA